jgi:hypothetical protein
MKASHNWMQHPVTRHRYELLADVNRTYQGYPNIMKALKASIMNGFCDHLDSVV